MSVVSPITQAIACHADQRPTEIALAIGAKTWSWRALIDEIGHRAQGLANADPLSPTFSASGVASELTPTVAPHANTLECALNGLARLYRGLPIIGMTSGSTAAAKRYRRSQDSWVASFSAQQTEFPIEASDTVIAPGSLAHSLFSYALCHGLYVGARVVLSESFRPDRVLQQIGDHQGSVLYATPTQLKMLLKAGGDADPDTLRLLLSSGARWFSEITNDLALRFSRAEIIEFYGASETSFISLARHSTDAQLPAGSVGKVFHGVNVSIAENHTIAAHSAGLFDGYLGERPPDFYEHQDADGRRWISVGDAGHIDANGYLFLSGRQSRKIVTSGKNLYPEEVEQALITHPALEYAALLGIFDDLRGERLVAAIHAKPGCELPHRAELIAFLAPMLEDFKIPRVFISLEQWPLTATGKTDFMAVQKLLQPALGRPVQTD